MPNILVRPGARYNPDQVRTLRAEGIVTWLLAVAGAGGLALFAHGRLALGDWYVAKTVFAVVVIAGFALAGLERYHAFTRLGPANGVTTLRAVLVALVVASVGETPAQDLALAIVSLSLLAVSLDGVDGWLARRSGMTSVFGARFDMEVDALLILALAILVWQHDRAGAWVLLAGLWRYLFVAAGWGLSWMRRPLPPSSRRQAICVVQIGGLVLAMIPGLSPVVQTTAAAVALTALSVSFLIDIAWLYRSDRRQQVA